jgi:LuxR family transcriptional regulator, maltose regulon positive regulatory protein
VTGSADRTATIATKLAPPCSPVRLVTRSRLHAALADGAAAGTTLVCAPAGSGKTALVSSWLASGEVEWPLAWLSLDRSDDDRRRFWSGVVAALARADPGDAGLAALRIPADGPIDGLFTALVERLAARSRPLVLVLDDVHELTDGGIAADLTALLRHAPAALRLLLVARADPPLRLQRLRVSGRLSEVRAADLAFDAGEAQELLAAWGAALDPADARELHRRTGGWAAGLVLGALALRGSDDPGAVVAGFGGEDRAVADFIRTELLAGQPAEVRRFLLRTSVARELAPGLAVVLAERTDAPELLERLTHGNACVEQLGGGAGYRYGPLFAELLRGELERTAPAELQGLHRRAARWHADDGGSGEAVRHALAAGDWELAAEVLGQRWLRLLLDGEGALLREVAERAPADLHGRWPEVALAGAAGCAEAGEARAAAALLARADRAAAALAPERASAFARGRAAVELLLGRARGELAAAVHAASVLASARRAGRAGEEGRIDEELRIAALVHLGAAELWCGQPEAALQRLEAGLAAARERELDAVVLLAQAHLALHDALCGRLVRAAGAAEAALALAERRGWGGSPAAATAQTVLAGALLHWERIDEAERVLGRAERTVRSVGEPPLRALVALERIALLSAEGAWDPAIALLRAAEAELEAWPLHPALRARFAAQEALLRAARGEREEAGALLERVRAEQPRPEHAGALGRLRLAAGEPGQASAAVAPWLERDGVAPAVAVDLWVTEALARDGLDDGDGATAALERALAHAEPDGFRHELLAHAPAVRGLLRRTIRSGTAHRAFAGELLDALESGRARPLPLAEPLSEREEAVLRCLPTMMSNREIASELYVSVNTVKTHLKHIYRKLDAGDRRSAVRRARELRLLAPAREPLPHGNAPVG